YEAIVDQASVEVRGGGDPVAAAALETGLGRNIEILSALVASLPTQAAKAIAPVIERAIERSGTAIDNVNDVKRPTPPAGGDGAGAGPGGGNPPVTAKPTRTPNERPEATPKPARTPKPTIEAPERGQPQGNPPPGDPAQGNPPQGNPPH